MAENVRGIILIKKLGQYFILALLITSGLIPCLSITGCSSSQTSKLIKKIFYRKEEASVKPTSRPEVLFGPTQVTEHSSFIDMTEEYGLAKVEATSLYAVDFNNDGYTDLVTLSSFYARPDFFVFNAFENKFEKLDYDPLPAPTQFSHLYFVDLDKDGVLDLIGSVTAQKTEIRTDPISIYKGILQGDKITYKKIDSAFTLKPFGPASLAVLDFDLDGQLDLFLGNWFNDRQNTRLMVPDELYKGSGFQFQAASGHLKQEYFKRDRDQKEYDYATPTFAVSTCDIDQDGWPDILTSSSGGYANKLWMNVFEKGGRYFTNQATESNYGSDDEGKTLRRGGGNTFFSSCVDYNQDGFMDIFMGELTHDYDDLSRDRSSILTGTSNTRPPYFIRDKTGEFTLTESDESWTRCDRRAVWLDYDNDGLEDFLVDNSGFPPSTRLILLKQFNDHSFEDMGRQEGINIVNPSGTVKIDLNQDGLWDIITGQTNIRNSAISKRVYVFLNRSERNGRRSIRFHLVGDKSNRQGLGAMVILNTQKKTMRQWVEYAQGSFQSQNESGIHFGLGDELPLSVKVVWPYAEKNKQGELVPLRQVYSLTKLPSGVHWEVTLCESGRWYEGRVNCQ